MEKKGIFVNFDTEGRARWNVGRLALLGIATLSIAAMITFLFLQILSGGSVTMEVVSRPIAASGSKDVGAIDISAEDPASTQSENRVVENVIQDDVKTVSVTDEPESPILASSAEVIEPAIAASQEAPVVAAPDEVKAPVDTMAGPLPEPVRGSGPDELRIGFITDTHVQSSGPSGRRALGRTYAARISRFVEQMNNVFGPDFLIVNGDIIEGTGQTSETGLAEIDLVKKLFFRSKIPTYWVIGNHDLRAVTKKQWKSGFGIDYEYLSFDLKGHRIIILDSNFTDNDKDVMPGRSYTRGSVSSEQVKWLKKKLESSGGLKPIVFIHHPPLRGLESKSNEGLLRNAVELRSLFAEHGVKAVFSGHIEDLYYEKTDGVEYFSIPGMTKHPKYQGMFAEVSVRGNDVEVDLNYLKNDGTYRKVRMKAE